MMHILVVLGIRLPVAFGQSVGIAIFGKIGPMLYHAFSQFIIFFFHGFRAKFHLPEHIGKLCGVDCSFSPKLVFRGILGVFGLRMVETINVNGTAAKVYDLVIGPGTYALREIGLGHIVFGVAYHIVYVKIASAQRRVIKIFYNEGTVDGRTELGNKSRILIELLKRHLASSRIAHPL